MFKNLNQDEINKLEKYQVKEAIKLLKNDKSFTSVKEVFDYVIQNYR